MYSYPFFHSGDSGLLGDQQTEQLFGFEAMLGRMIEFERALTNALHTEEEISEAVRKRTTDLLDVFQPDTDLLCQGLARDGVVVPELVRQVRSALPEDCRKALHKGATSQDVVDTALSMTLCLFHDVASERAGAINALLQQLMDEHGSAAITARTRMQPAGMAEVSSRLSNWQAAVLDAINDASRARKLIDILQFYGPVGDRSSMPLRNPDMVAQHIAGTLGLRDNGTSWQTNRRGLVSYAAWLGLISGSLGKIGQDLCLMAQADEVTYQGGGSSSSIPGKQNPVGAEVLVSLGRFNAVLVSGMQHAMLHEQERSGASWTLEWMILPQICIATGASLRIAQEALANITGFSGGFGK